MGFEPMNIGFANRRQNDINIDKKDTYKNSKTGLAPQLAPFSAKTAKIDPDLQAIIDRWQSLPEHIRQAIKSLVKIEAK